MNSVPVAPTPMHVALGSSALSSAIDSQSALGFDTFATMLESMPPHVGTLPLAEYLRLKEGTKQDKKRAKDDKDCAWYSLAGYRGTTRNKSSVEFVSGFGADLDSGQHTLADIAAKLAGYVYLAHTTHSHSAERPRFRVVIPYAQPIDMPAHRRMFDHFNALFDGQLDTAASDPSRLWYYRSCCADTVGLAQMVVQREGTFFDALALLSSACLSPAAPAPEHEWTTAPVWHRGPGTLPELMERERKRNPTLERLLTGNRDALKSGGDDSSVDFALCCELLRANGGDDEELLELMQSETLALCRDKWGREDWLRMTIANAHAEVAKTPPINPARLGFGGGGVPPGYVAPVALVPTGTAPVPGSRFTPVNAWNYADGPDPKWRVAQLLPEQGLAMIYGPSGVGKSFFVLDLVMAIALGKKYGHDQRQVTPGRVVYVVAEGAGGFRKRLRAYRVHHKLNANSPAPLLVPATPNLTSVPDVIELRDAILGAGGADVTILDTLHASSAGADENSAKDMGLYLGHCRALQAATGGLVLLVHHSGKDEERGARGSSALRAAMDTELEISRAADDLCMARVTKQRDGDDSAVVCFRLASVLSTASAVVEHVARPAKVRKQRTSAEQALVLQQLQELAPTYPEGVQMNVLKVAISSVRPDMKASNIERSITRAIDSGLLTIDSAQVVRPVRGGPALSGFGPQPDEAA